MTFTRRFRPGQVLFGKRRVYQSKAAAIDFEGVCSGDILVFEAIPDRLTSEFLPLVLHSEDFQRHALATSAGSLSPRTNWTDLAKYTFRLPPLGDQRRIAELLWATETAGEMYGRALEALESVRQSWRSEIFSRWTSGPTCSLDELYEVQLGKKLDPKVRVPGQDMRPYLRNINVRWRRFDFTDIKKLSFSGPDRDVLRLRNGDVLACEGRDVGRSAVWRDQLDECYYQNTLHRLRPKNQTLPPDILVEYFSWCSESGRFAKLVGDSLIPHLTAARLRKLSTPVPTPKDALSFLEQLNEFDSTEASLRSQIDRTVSMRNAHIGIML
ncbi:restriction endonuclease subunit S [Kibdelosporangium persicum]|uniref:restriction endonuclease subunit S n=1 Tax=Kibdelosporangium persicum TaxID=2698649 RepID=UPI0035E43654